MGVQYITGIIIYLESYWYSDLIWRMKLEAYKNILCFHAALCWQKGVSALGKVWDVKTKLRSLLSYREPSGRTPAWHQPSQESTYSAGRRLLVAQQQCEVAWNASPLWVCFLGCKMGWWSLPCSRLYWIPNEILLMKHFGTLECPVSVSNQALFDSTSPPFLELETPSPEGLRNWPCLWGSPI